MIPVKYNVRNLRVRWVTTLMTVLGDGAGRVGDGAHVRPDRRAGARPADQRRSARSDRAAQRLERRTASGIEQQTRPRRWPRCDGIARDADGQPLCSVEFVTILTKPRRGNGGTTNLIVRGLETVGRELRPGFQIVEGRDLQPGVNEAITSAQHGRAVREPGDRREAGDQQGSISRSSATSRRPAARPSRKSGPTCAT